MSIFDNYRPHLSPGNESWLVPVKLNRSHRYSLAQQRMLYLYVQNPMGGDKDG